MPSLPLETSSTAAWPSLSSDLHHAGWSVGHGAFPAPLIQTVRAWAAQASLPWQAAGTGKGASYRPVSVRGDRIAWLDLVAGTPAERAVGDHLRAVMAHLNRTLFLNLVDVEAHLAVYPPGHGYARHRDRFCNDDARTVSWVTYLNAPDWTEGDGGALRLHLPEGPQDVLPRRGTAVAFLSADIEHEVCAATRERWSIAAWFRQRPLG